MDLYTHDTYIDKYISMYIHKFIYIYIHRAFIFRVFVAFQQKACPKRNKLLRMQRWKSWKTLRRRQGGEAPVASNGPKEKLSFGNLWVWNTGHI